MRRLLIRLIVLAAVITGATAVGHSTAYADTVCKQTDPATGKCLIWAEAPATPTRTNSQTDDLPADTGPGAPCYWDPSQQNLTAPAAGPVKCHSKLFGYWSNTYRCYLQALHPQPPADDPRMEGHVTGDGAVYSCYQPQTGMAIYIWAADPPPAAAAGPSPRDVAEIAIKQMNLSAIDIGITPEPGPDHVGLVGMPVWLWAKNPDAHTYGPATASASAGGITITATARVHEITWNLGDGTTVACQNAGTPYQPRFGKKASPTCGHVYTKSSAHQPDQKYTVTATSSWVITWDGAGQTGTIRLNGLTRSVQIAVGEAQVLVS